jgi:hypothetical protein
MALSTEGKFGILVGLFALGGGGAVWVAPDHTEIGWLMIAAAAIGGIALAFHHFDGALTRIWNPGNNARMIALAGMIVCGIGVIGFSGVYFWPTAAPVITLKYLYDHDFGNFMTDNIGFDLTVKVADKAVKFSFSARMIFDFEHRSRWLSYYIPLDQNTFGISAWLIAHTDDLIIPKFDNEVSETNGGMLGSGALSSKELTFSRRIYIYHEFILTDSQMAEVQHEATEKNLDVVFRGISYRQAMRSNNS